MADKNTRTSEEIKAQQLPTQPYDAIEQALKNGLQRSKPGAENMQHVDLRYSPKA